MTSDNKNPTLNFKLLQKRRQFSAIQQQQNKNATYSTPFIFHLRWYFPECLS
ncbi:Hypothetical protein CINCED_3A005827 [Cinara cedri]|uniref:Uncharacterized protein n=1 Tax=Cinara cedri TaxID=506608 RepID=A0A5E4NGX2_9HEMI|nr:Hypothetical protein CINCED_3A005827 [Cinara cedri]